MNSDRGILPTLILRRFNLKTWWNCLLSPRPQCFIPLLHAVWLDLRQLSQWFFLYFEYNIGHWPINLKRNHLKYSDRPALTGCEHFLPKDYYGQVNSNIDDDDVNFSSFNRIFVLFLSFLKYNTYILEDNIRYTLFKEFKKHKVTPRSAPERNRVKTTVKCNSITLCQNKTKQNKNKTKQNKTKNKNKKQTNKKAWFMWIKIQLTFAISFVLFLQPIGPFIWQSTHIIWIISQ